MDGNDDSGDGWTDLMLSPKGLFPGFVSNPCFTKLASESHSGGSVPEAEIEKGKDDSLQETEDRFEEHENGLSDLGGTDSFVAKAGGSIAERRASKFGFGSLKISTSRFQSSGAMASPAARSPYLLKTPGLSPSALLESPVFLPNLQPSPTTGAFLLPHKTIDGGMANSAPFSAEKIKGSDDATSFTFKPHIESNSLPFYSAPHSQPPSNFSQSSEVERSSATTQPTTGAFEFPTQFPSVPTARTQSEFGSQHDSIIPSDMAVKADSATVQPRCSVVASGIEVQHSDESNQGEYIGVDQTFDGDQKVVNLTGVSGSTSEDGYSWRKYGQKQVKGSEFPRSYYKCTHPSCPVKKKVEHSYEGQVTEIVYTGAHNHPKPQPNRRPTFSSATSCGDLSDVSEGGGSAKAEGGSVWRNDLKLGSDWRPDNLERTCSASIATDVSDPLPATEGKSVSVLESAGTPEHSTLASNDDEDEDEDAATQGSMPVTGDEDIEPDLKRRKMEEVPLMETALGSRAIREPRVIVQIESEVDILDDGYRWRKYGQKVVKGNPNPRSYYKCTHPGCTVRKHVERASHNLKCVLTTYEGKHNHEVPTARNSSHTNSGGGNSAPSIQNMQGSMALPRNSYLPKSEPQDLAPRSNRNVEYNKNFLRPNYLGNFAGGASSIYQMRFPPLPNNMVYGAFGVNPNPMGESAPGPGLSIPPPMGFPMSSNVAASDYDNQGRPPGLIQPNFTGQQPNNSDAQVLRPMQD